MKTWLGTSGFQYPEWKGKFYPDGMPASRMLRHYAERLSSTEVNYTFRSLPSEKTVARWLAETPANFRFSLKAPQRVTHFARLRGCAEIMAAFQNSIAKLGEKRGPVLFQLPPNFAKDTGRLDAYFDELPAGLAAAFEFRHESWFAEDIYEVLRRRRAALCLAESEDLMVPREVTADFGYLRLRREDYTPKDLRRWADFLREQKRAWREVFIYFKHEETASGPRFAEALQKLLHA